MTGIAVRIVHDQSGRTVRPGLQRQSMVELDAPVALFVVEAVTLGQVHTRRRVHEVGGHDQHGLDQSGRDRTGAVGLVLGLVRIVALREVVAHNQAGTRGGGRREAGALDALDDVAFDRIVLIVVVGATGELGRDTERAASGLIARRHQLRRDAVDGVEVHRRAMARPE